ncbi:MAG TPA: hypothetical protein VJO53_05835 [Candidatus Acidoferrales bacterium]|nr:hypothetical protein [Candidatus Acidoferrales bacterium]
MASVALEIEEPQSIDLELEKEGARRSPAGNQSEGNSTLNVRAVGFIASPGRVRELTECIRGSLTGLLKKVDGFAGTIILQTHEEMRSLLVLTYWETEHQAKANRWEDFSVTQDLVTPYIDARTRVQTYQAMDACQSGPSLERCHPHQS